MGTYTLRERWRERLLREVRFDELAFVFFFEVEEDLLFVVFVVLGFLRGEAAPRLSGATRPTPSTRSSKVSFEHIGFILYIYFVW